MRKISDGFFTGFAWLSGMGALLIATLLLGFLLLRGMKSITPALFFGETPWLEAITGSTQSRCPGMSLKMPSTMVKGPGT